jgi:uncharacterized membrane protein
MPKKLLSTIKPLLKSLLAIALVITLALGNAGDALAARSGGRIGGGSFRSPSRTFSSGSRSYQPPSSGYYPSGGYYNPGGGIGFPFLLPLFGFGGGFGGLFSILIFLAIANFLVQTFRRVGASGEDDSLDYSNPKVSVAEVQVGLLAQARNLQAELNELANTADTSSDAGRAQVLQESTLALLRHPEYWVYGAAQSQQALLESAEAKFNQLALAERSKFAEETLSNVNNLLRQAAPKTSLPVGSGELVDRMAQPPGEYIVVTIVVGAQANLQLPPINDADDLRQALRQIGSIGSDRLLALEVLWTPQAEGDTLTTDDMLAYYPNLKLI